MNHWDTKSTDAIEFYLRNTMALWFWRDFARLREIWLTGYSILDLLIVSLMFALVTFMILYAFREAAYKAKNDMMIYLSSVDSDKIKIVPYSKEDCLQRLETMTLWPMRYPSFGLLMTWILLAELSVLFYRIGPLCLAIAVVLGIIRRPSNSENPNLGLTAKRP